jgi:hypothetical protein
MIFCLKQKLLQSQKIITLSTVNSKNNLVLQYDLNIYATQAKIYGAATFLAHVIQRNLRVVYLKIERKVTNRGA